MESCDALLAALDSYEGAVVVVTHNEMFLNALAERLIVFQNDSVSVFEGGYDRFLTKVGWSEEKEQSAAETPADQAAKPGSREMRKLRAEIITRRSKVLKPLEKRIHGAETEIDRLENELKKLHEGMIEASHGQDGVKIAALSQEIHRCEERIDELFGELSEVTSEYEMKKKEFESMSV
jgi:ATP-binding cassette subfamily F protein 3